MEEEKFEAVSIELLENMLATAQQRQQTIVAQINKIAVQQQQSDMQKGQLLEEALIVQGRIETLQQLTQKEEEGGSEGQVIPFVREEDPKGQEGEAGPKGNS